MKKRLLTISIAGKVVAAIILCFMSSRSVHAADRPLSPKIAAEHTFQADLQDLSKSKHITILAESAPIVDVAAKASGLKAANLSPSEAVRSLAERYDYSVTQLKGVYLLNKRYRDPHDTPDITLAEALAALHDIGSSLQVIRAPEPDANGELPGPRLCKMLDADQAAALAHGIPVGSLTEAQRTQAFRLALSVEYNSVISAVDEASAYLSSIKLNGTQFHSGPVDTSTDEFGFDYYCVSRTDEGVGLAKYLKPLSHPDTIFFSPDGRAYVAIVKDREGSIITADAAEPAPEVNYAGIRGALNGCMPLASAVKALKAGDHESVGFTADPDISDIGVSIAGQEYSPPSEVMDALAQLLSLQARHNRGGGVTLTRRKSPLPVDYADLPVAISTAVPARFTRYISARGSSARDNTNDGMMHFHLYLVGKALEYEAARQLRAEAEPMAKLKESGSLPLSDVSRSGCSELALSQTARVLAMAVACSGSKLPKWLSDFDHTTLMGSIIKDGEYMRYKVYLNWTDPTTRSTISSPATETVQGHAN